ncbi:MAG: response regulator transcription factor [Chitinispirillaceae bacterium]|jgi:DNA-binding NarL/FixJ family response regulator|nr:response regulator transcription factor [Chitinispirillaceae bacterium]
MEKTRVLIVDDHPISRLGLTQLINQEQDFTVCGSAEDTPGVIKAIEEQKPDIVIMDISLKQENGIGILKTIKKSYPSIKTLMVSMHDEALYAERALRAGALGYVMKQDAIENITRALRTIRSGTVFVSAAVQATMIQSYIGGPASAPAPRVEALLSDRELEVFKLIGDGFATRQIAEKLCLSSKTVETHRANIKDKLKISDAPALTTYAVQWMRLQ